MLRIQNLSKEYEKPVLSSFSYEFPQQGAVLLRGGSGVGKTTLLRLIAGLESPSSGEISFSEEPVISMVFQEARLIPHCNVLENLLVVRKEKDTEKALSLLSSLSLDGAEKKFPHELSGGMKLRVAIARSLYYGGNLFLWDEPTKELDPKNREVIAQIIQEVSRKHLIIIATHDPFLKGDRDLYLLSPQENP
jgi:ABC-type nitrate/sulfonate/bicarbonate transport system ATPase subunit